MPLSDVVCLETPARAPAETPTLERVNAASGVPSSILLLIGAIASAAIAVVALTPDAFRPDTWLSLLAGREIWNGGLPHHDALTQLTAGVNWVDQQWLSQLFAYALYRTGGLGLVALAYIAILVSALGVAVLCARRLRASASSVTMMFALTLPLTVIGAQVRPQTFAYPLFVVTLYLLAADSRHPSRRVYWCLPLLVLWANLHGSATLGAGLVSLRGITLAWEQRHTLLTNRRAWTRPLTLTIAAPLCLLATPYGASAITYYHDTLLNPAFRQFIADWQPIPGDLTVAAPFFVLAGITLWSFGRYADRTTLWERCALLFVGAGAIASARNAVWFGFASLVLLPLSIDAVLRARGRSRRPPRALVLASALAALTLLTAVITAGVTAGRPASAFDHAYPRRVLSAIDSVTATDPSARVFADANVADWLLWQRPRLRGRVAYDARFELLSQRQFRAIVDLEEVVGPAWKRVGRGYRLVVLNYANLPDSAKAFEAEPGRRVLYRGGGYEVILRNARRAA